MRQARYRAEAEVEYLKKQLDERNKAAPSTAPAPAPTVKPVDITTPLNSDDFASYDLYLDARDLQTRARWEKEQAEKTKQTEDAKAAKTVEEQTAVHSARFEERQKIVMAKMPDYQKHFDAFFTVAKAIPALGTAVFESELSADVADHLGSRPDELARIAPLAPGRIWAEIGKLEARLTEDKGSPPPITKAPRPLSDVSGTAGSAPKELSIEERMYGKN